MSKGTQITTLRLHPFVRSAILAELSTHNTKHPKKPLTITEWIERACLEKLRHKARSEKCRRNRILSSDIPDPVDPNDCFTPSDVSSVMEVPEA